MNYEVIGGAKSEILNLSLRKSAEPNCEAAGWKHKIEVEEGVRRLFEWYRGKLLKYL